MKLIDTHCHIHSPEFFTTDEAEQAYKDAVAAGVERFICVATSLEDSKAAIAFAKSHSEHCRATIGIHPHEAKSLDTAQIANQLKELTDLADDPMVVAVGECGFDFFYNKKDEVLDRQRQLLTGQITIAQKNNLPLSFHVREGFDEFWEVFDSFDNVRGVLHSFTDKKEHAERAIARKLYFGINGIATFTTHQRQIDLFKNLPLESIVLETDAPFLTPKPKRGKLNKPENVIYITKLLAELRGEDADTIARCSTANARRLFGLD